MKALFYDGHLSVKETETPIPQKNEALIRILLAGICRTDIEITKGYMDFKGIPGHEFVGRVESCENGDWVGKRVVGEINIACDDCSFCKRGMHNHCAERTVLGIQGKNGTFAEYITLPWKNLHEVPSSIKEEEAVFIEPLAAACRILEQINITKNDHVLVLGDGKLGLLIGQVLFQTGCDLLCAGKHPKKLSLLSSLGIPTQLESDAKDINFDIVIEASGHPLGLGKAFDHVRPEGTIILKSTYHNASGIETMKVVVDEIKLVGSRCGPFPPAIALLKSKKVSVSSLVSEIFSLDASLEAFRAAILPDSIKILLRP